MGRSSIWGAPLFVVWTLLGSSSDDDVDGWRCPDALRSVWPHPTGALLLDQAIGFRILIAQLSAARPVRIGELAAEFGQLIVEQAIITRVGGHLVEVVEPEEVELHRHEVVVVVRETFPESVMYGLCRKPLRKQGWAIT